MSKRHRSDDEGDWWDKQDDRRDDDFPPYLPSKAEWIGALTMQYGDPRLMPEPEGTIPEDAPRCLGCNRHKPTMGGLCRDCERDLSPKGDRWL